MKTSWKRAISWILLCVLVIGMQPARHVSAAEVVYRNNLEEAAADLRKGMVQRQTSIPVGLTMGVAVNLNQQMVEDLFQMALIHTGNPKEGDYINWQYDYSKMGMDYEIGRGGVILNFKVSYYSTAEQEAELDILVEELIDSLGVRELSSEYEKVKIIYDYLCENIKLDKANQNNSQYVLQYTAYAALKNKTAACRGFSALLYRLLLELGIDSRIVLGTTGGQLHTWNIVQMEDGLYYNLDATYDSNLNQHQCFLKCDSAMPNHVRSDEYATEEFYQKYPSGETDYTYEENAMPELRILGASLVLQNNLSINYKVDSELFTDGGYVNPYLLFEMNGVQTVVDTFTEKEGYYYFAYSNIAPHQMTDTIRSTLYADFNGTKYKSETKDYSIATYCYSMLEKSDENQNKELKTLLVDMLGYGSKSQKYMGYKLDQLADAGLTETQKTWGTLEDRLFVDAKNAEYVKIENPLVTWKGAGLILKDSIAMRFTIEAESVDGLSVKIASDVGEWEISSEGLAAGEILGQWYLSFSGLNVAQLSEKVYLTVYRGDVPVSNTVCYSVESYAYAKQNDSNTELAELVKAMMKYGDAAKAYLMSSF